MFAASKTDGVSGAVNYIEDVFSTYLYTGTGATQTITNSIDTTTYGGLVWIKGRSGATGHRLTDTARGVTKSLASETTAAQATEATGLTAFGTTGFTIGADADYNTSAATYASWTFRKQPKFFDVVTFTSNSSGGATFSHNLGATPAFVIVKCTSTTENWWAWSDTFTSTQFITLNLTNAKQTGTAAITVNSTQVTLGNGWLTNNNASYVAYLFASNAGGFGLTGTDNVISCGSFTGAATVNLGWEPQFILYKTVNVANDWKLVDNMRGLVVDNGSGTGDKVLKPNLANAELGDYVIDPTSTGFIGYESVSNTHIYIAIRRGPMKVPTSGTSVFSPVAANNAQGTQNTTGFPVDLQLQAWRDGVNSKIAVDRLRGVSTTATNSEQYLVTNTTAAEVAGTNLTQYWNNTGFQTASGWASFSNVYWNFRRAPSFFDVVCYTGTGGTGSRSLSHNLQAVPELVILKSRSGVANWQTGSMFTSTTVTRAVLNRNDDQDLNSLYSGQSIWGGQPTASTFLIDASGSFNTSAATYVAYLFATCAGVSKVGSYTGTGTTQQINCGFASGARFVLIRRANSTGDWYVWDSARGIVAGNDPYLLLNSTAAEVTSTDYIDTYSAGFEISSTAPAAINASGGTFIFLAIA